MILRCDDPDVAAEVTLPVMKNAIHRARASLYPPVPITLENLSDLLSQQHQRVAVSRDGKDTIFGGSVHTNGMVSVIFLSRRLRRYLRKVKLVFCDGTFGSRPNSPQSAQVLQIVTVVRNTVSIPLILPSYFYITVLKSFFFFQAIPLVQVLMHSKQEEEYVNVLQYLRELVPQFRPRYVMTDYECAMQNAWKQVFPDCSVAGCYWHFCRVSLLSFTSSVVIHCLFKPIDKFKYLFRLFFARHVRWDLCQLWHKIIM